MGGLGWERGGEKWPLTHKEEGKMATNPHVVTCQQLSLQRAREGSSGKQAEQWWATGSSSVNDRVGRQAGRQAGSTS